MGPLGDIAKAIAEVTELKRAVQILNSRLENHTAAIDRLASVVQDAVADARCKYPPQMERGPQ